MEQEKRIENRRKGSKKYIVMLFLLVLIVGGGCGLYYVDTFYGQGKINTILSSLQQDKNATKDTEDAEDLQVPEEQQVTDKNSMTLSSGGTLFLTKGKKFLMCTKDGARYMNSINDQKWNDTFTMTAPEMIEENKYYAIGDLSGKSVKVYNDTGLLYSVQHTGNVLYFALNRNGYLGVITKEKEMYTVMIYDSEGTQLTGRQEGQKGVFPLSIDVSDDNRVFAISYLDTTDVEPVGKVNFYYVNESDGKNYSESMFSAVIKNNEIIPKVFYLDNGSLIAASDRALYGIGANGEQRWEIVLTNHINYIGLEKKKYIVLAYGAAISGQNNRTEGNVSWINGDGKEIASFQPRDTVTYLNCNNTGTVVGCNKTYYGLKIGGRPFWEYTATRDMTDVILMENVNNVLFVTSDSAVILNMDRVSQDTTVKEQKQDDRNTEKIIRKKTEDDQQQEDNKEDKDTQQQDDDNIEQQENQDDIQNNENNIEEEKEQNQDKNNEKDTKKEQNDTKTTEKEQKNDKKEEKEEQNESEPSTENQKNKEDTESGKNSENEVKQNSRGGR